MSLAKVSQLAFIDDGPYRVHVKREKKGTRRGIVSVTWPSWIPAAVMCGEDRVKFEDPGQQKGLQGLTLLAWQPGAK